MANEEYIKNIESYLNNLNDSEKDDIKKIFLSKIYASFFIFEPTNGNPNARLVIDTFLGKRLGDTSKNTILDVSHFFNSDNLGLEGINIGRVYLYPFIKISYNNFKLVHSQNINEVLKNFEGIFYRYLCVMEFEGKIIIFTDISEDFFDKSINDLLFIGYRKIELHNIIPRIIDTLSEKFKDGTAEIEEMGVSFPLSMLGSHASISNKIKSGVKISTDKNFKNIIRYGLLDFVKISSNFKISFNSDNEKDKYRLHGFIYNGEQVNIKIIQGLYNFIKEIDKTDIKNEEESNFAGLPIYVIAGKRSYKDKIMYPIFTYEENKNKNHIYYELKLEFNGYANPDGIEDNINGEYIITGIYPQYLKKWVGLDNRKDLYCYLKLRENTEEWKITHDNIKNIFGEQKYILCDDFLNEIRNNIANSYRYFNEEDVTLEGHNHPNLMTSDLFLTAISKNDKSDFLINITNPKRGNLVLNDKLGKKISVDLYKLSSFDFNQDKIINIINSYTNSVFKGIFELGVIEKIPYCPKESAKFKVNNTLFTELKTKCTEAKDGRAGKGLIDTYLKPPKYKDISYIDDYLKLEDIWSLALIELLEQKGNKTFFGGKKKGSLSRELADIISIRDFETKNGVNINFYHMKLSPFEQKSDSVIEAAFSHYTEVVGQILEKIKSFLYVGNLDSIIKSLEQYFIQREQKSSNYVIFEALKLAIQENSNKIINFNIYFPIKEKDYFNTEYLDDTNNLKRLGLETNWKRLKIINEIFKTNVSNINPNMKINLNLGLIICKKENTYLNGSVKTKVLLINNIEKLLNI